MKTNNHHERDNSEVGAEQVTNSQHEAIYVGVDMHKQSITLTRIIDHSTAQPPQRFDWPGFWAFMQKQVGLARKVYAVYEAGAFGFWPCRRLQAMGIDCRVMHPEKLDPQHKRVQTDKRDSRELAGKLQRYVLGNTRAMTAVYMPSEKEEQERMESRHRDKLSRQIRSLKARGRGLLLSQGIFEYQGWWRPALWNELKQGLFAQLVAALEDTRAQIELLEKQLKQVEKKLRAAAPPELPVGFGRLTYVLLLREICSCERFANRRQVGGFTGLCGAVSSSGPYHLDLSINKAGSGYVRALLIELAWRMVYWQPRYRGLKPWNELARSGGLTHARRRKSAIVAVARRLMVDIWKWQTQRTTAQELGWKLGVATAA